MIMVWKYFFHSMDKCMPEVAEGAQWAQLRLGKYCPDQNRPRPIRVLFKSMDDKHTFLKHAKHLKEVNLRYDDDLTRLQQKQRQDMSADFDTLKSKGHKPFYRGSLLKFRHADRHAHAGGMGQLELQMPKFSAT